MSNAALSSTMDQINAMNTNACALINEARYVNAMQLLVPALHSVKRFLLMDTNAASSKDFLRNCTTDSIWQSSVGFYANGTRSDHPPTRLPLIVESQQFLVNGNHTSSAVGATRKSTTASSSSSSSSSSSVMAAAVMNENARMENPRAHATNTCANIPATIPRLAFVIIYNISLVSHLQALDEVNDADKKQRLAFKTLTLYTQAQTLVRNMAISLPTLPMAALTINMANAHEIIGRRDEAFESYRQSLRLLVSIQDDEKRRDGNGETFEYFYWAVISAIQGSAPMAEAA